MQHSKIKNSSLEKNYPPENTACRLAVGVSGGGTTFEAIAKEIRNNKLNLELCFIFADRPCGALEKAQKMGIKFVQKRAQETIHDFHKRIVLQLTREKIDFVALAGYLRLFPITNTDSFLVLNSHPAAIPHFGGEGMWGQHVHRFVIDWAKKVKHKYPYTFSTIHIATDQYDRGPIVGIMKCKILKSDTPETLASRLLPIEHANYIDVLQSLSMRNIEYQEYPNDFLTIANSDGKI